MADLVNVGTAANSGDGDPLRQAFQKINAKVDLIDTAIAARVASSEKGAANGVASLDAGGKIDPIQLPAIAITETFESSSQAAMLALNAQIGDVCVRSDLNQSFILADVDPTVLANWIRLLTPTDAVLSVAGKTGAVSLNTSDISGFSAAAASAAPVQSVAGRTGAVTLSASDVSGFSTVATSGAYADLSGRPSIPSKTSDLSNDSGYITSSGAPVQSVAGRTGAVTLSASDVSGLASVATSGSYSSLSGRPTLGTISSQDASSIAITGGAINGTTIGATTPAAGTFTTITASGNVGIGTSSPTKKLEVVGDTFMNGRVTHESGWRDNVAPFTKAVAGSSAPTLSDPGNGSRVYRFASGDSMHVEFHTDHDVEAGSTAYPHIHFFSSTAMTAGQTVTWQFIYVMGKGHHQGAVMTGARTTINMTYTATGTEVAGEHIILEATSGVVLAEPDMIMLAEYKYTGGTHGGNVYGMMGDLHYRSNRETTPNKTPSFT